MLSNIMAQRKASSVDEQARLDAHTARLKADSVAARLARTTLAAEGRASLLDCRHLDPAVTVTDEPHVRWNGTGFEPAAGPGLRFLACGSLVLADRAGGTRAVGDRPPFGGGITEDTSGSVLGYPASTFVVGASWHNNHLAAVPSPAVTTWWLDVVTRTAGRPRFFFNWDGVGATDHLIECDNATGEATVATWTSGDRTILAPVDTITELQLEADQGDGSVTRLWRIPLVVQAAAPPRNLIVRCACNTADGGSFPQTYQVGLARLVAGDTPPPLDVLPLGTDRPAAPLSVVDVEAPHPVEPPVGLAMVGTPTVGGRAMTLLEMTNVQGWFARLRALADGALELEVGDGTTSAAAVSSPDAIGFKEQECLQLFVAADGGVTVYHEGVEARDVDDAELRVTGIAPPGRIDRHDIGARGDGSEPATMVLMLAHLNTVPAWVPPVRVVGVSRRRDMPAYPVRTWLYEVAHPETLIEIAPTTVADGVVRRYLAVDPGRITRLTGVLESGTVELTTAINGVPVTFDAPAAIGTSRTTVTATADAIFDVGDVLTVTASSTSADAAGLAGTLAYEVA